MTRRQEDSVLPPSRACRWPPWQHRALVRLAASAARIAPQVASLAAAADW